MQEQEPKRFQDKNYRISEFYKDVVVHCLGCNNKAIATVNFETKTAKLICTSCGYSKQENIYINIANQTPTMQTAAHLYFGAKLWLQLPFKNEIVWAYNYQHLDYLEAYIAATIRESNNRTHFTLLEKLPKFYHDAKNRIALLKLMEKLKEK